MNTAKVVLPVIHNNGTSKDSLMESLSYAGKALREAMDALARCEPNERDYYCHEHAGAGTTARLDHHERIARLRSVYQELQVLGYGVSQGGHQRGMPRNAEMDDINAGMDDINEAGRARRTA